MENKICSICSKDKPLSDFYTEPSGRTKSACIKCESRRVLERRMERMTPEDRGKSLMRILAKEKRERLLQDGKIECLTCRTIQHTDQFQRRKKGDGFGFRCKSCQLKIDRAVAAESKKNRTPEQKALAEWSDEQQRLRSLGKSRCTVCKGVFEIGNFAGKTSTGKISGRCKPCELERAKEKHRINAQLSTDRHRDKIEEIRAKTGDNKVCSKCGNTKPLSEYYYCKTTMSLKPSCKECENEYFTQRENSEDRKKARVGYRRKWNQKNEDKVSAHGKLNRAIKAGIISKPDHCSECGDAGRIVGHHRDYAKPLDVLWLCEKCHKKNHVQTINT